MQAKTRYGKKTVLNLQPLIHGRLPSRDWMVTVTKYTLIIWEKWYQQVLKVLCLHTAWAIGSILQTVLILTIFVVKWLTLKDIRSILQLIIIGRSTKKTIWRYWLEWTGLTGNLKITGRRSLTLQILITSVGIKPSARRLPAVTSTGMVSSVSSDVSITIWWTNICWKRTSAMMVLLNFPAICNGAHSLLSL